MALRVYGDPSLRQSTDLDLFVKRADVSHAHDVLRELGYDGIIPDALSRRTAFIESSYVLAFRSPDALRVELHWNIVLRRFAIEIDFDDIWRRSERMTFAGRQISCCAPEDLLLLLCVHGARHQWRRIEWICDVAELIRSSPAIAWNEIRLRAHDSSVERIVRLGLFLARRLLGAVTPPDVDAWILEDPRVAALAAQIRDSFDTKAIDEPGVFSAARFDVAVRQRKRDKLRYLWRAAFTPTECDWTLVSLPESLEFGYWVLHPTRLAMKYAAHGLRLRRSS